MWRGARREWEVGNPFVDCLSTKHRTQGCSPIVDIARGAEATVTAPMRLRRGVYNHISRVNVFTLFVPDIYTHARHTPGSTVLPARQEEVVAEGGTSDAVDRAGVSLISLEVLFVVANGALVDQPILCAGEVCRSISRRKVERQAAGLSRDDALCVAC